MTKLFAAALLGATMLAVPAHATIIATGSGTIDASDPAQTGRLFRNGVASTWATPKAFPGYFTMLGAYNYELVTINYAPNATQNIYYRITATDPSTAFHPTAYVDTFNPNALGANYVGDPGASGGTIPFEVTISAGSQLLLVFALNNPGTTTSFGYQVEAFLTPPLPSVPEPATWAMMIGGFAVAGAALRGRRTVRFAM